MLFVNSCNIHVNSKITFFSEQQPFSENLTAEIMHQGYNFIGRSTNSRMISWHDILCQTCLQNISERYSMEQNPLKNVNNLKNNISEQQPLSENLTVEIMHQCCNFLGRTSLYNFILQCDILYRTCLQNISERYSI